MHKQKQKNSNSRLRDAQEIPSFKTFRKSPLPCIHKERQYEANSEIKNKSNKYLDKKMSYLLSSNIQDLFQLKLTQPLKSPGQPKRKLIRPWAARPIDPNLQTIKPNKLQLAEDLFKTRHFRRSSLRESMLNNKEFDEYNSQIKENQNYLETVKLGKAISVRQKSETRNRDKTVNCKIALRKSIFPTNLKQYQQQKLAEKFQRQQDLLSTIEKNQQDDERFMSIQSYTNLVF